MSKASAITGDGDGKGARHDEGEAWVPGACDVEEVENLGRVDHAGDGNAEAEDQSDEDGGEEPHLRPPPHAG